jgi:hypothetical protein
MAEDCAASIDRPETSNEWRVQDYVPVGCRRSSFGRFGKSKAG